MQYGSVFIKIVHDIISGSVIGHFTLAIQFSRQYIAVGSRCPLWPGALGQLPHLASEELHCHKSDSTCLTRIMSKHSNYYTTKTSNND